MIVQFIEARAIANRQAFSPGDQVDSKTTTDGYGLTDDVLARYVELGIAKKVDKADPARLRKLPKLPPAPAQSETDASDGAGTDGETNTPANRNQPAAGKKRRSGGR